MILKREETDVGQEVEALRRDIGEMARLTRKIFGSVFSVWRYEPNELDELNSLVETYEGVQPSSMPTGDVEMPW